MTLVDKVNGMIEVLDQEAADLFAVEADPSTGRDRGYLPDRDKPLWDALADAIQDLVTVREMYKERNL